MSKVTEIELAIYRGRMLRDKFASGALTDACKIVSRHVTRIERIRELECNGIQVYAGPNRPTYARPFTDAESEQMGRDVAESQKAIVTTLKPFLKQGVVFKFYPDPRAAVARISDKTNSKDCFIGV